MRLDQWLLHLLAFFCFISPNFTYVHIFSTELRMPFVEGKTSVFSTCLCHIDKYFVYPYWYLWVSKSHTESSTSLDFILNFSYFSLSTLNPGIYSLRNEAVDTAQRKIFFFKEKHLFLYPLFSLWEPHQ